MRYIEIIRELAQSQGFYGRLLEQFENDESKRNAFIEICEKSNINDPIDLIMLIEG